LKVNTLGSLFAFVCEMTAPVSQHLVGRWMRICHDHERDSRRSCALNVFIKTAILGDYASPYSRDRRLFPRGSSRSRAVTVGAGYLYE